LAIKTIRGITWDHSRAFPPLVTAAQRYEELHPGIRIHWDKRTLDEFGHKPIDQLVNDYDLIVIDHPWAGFCFDRNLVLDIKSFLTGNQWNDLQQNCVGASFESYCFENKLLAVPIDTATPVPSWRPDLVNKSDFQLPVTWSDLISMADRKHVIMPGFGADLFLNWLMLLHALDARPFRNADNIADKEKSIEAMSLLKRLAEPMPVEMLDWNPIIIAELMTSHDTFVYCPFAYSYGNYCRPYFAGKPLRYGNLIQLNGKPLKSILGGTGISISSGSKEIELALDFSLYCAGASVQSGIYAYAGGQPARKEAWLSQHLTSFTGGFFSDSYLSHENALVRPRYNGYVSLQEKAGIPLQQFIKGNISISRAWNAIEECYHQSRALKI
jgi:multiple sugar transport system substrate-binding protein